MAASKANTAVSFDEIIKADRQRRKNEALAKEIFGKGRRSSAPGTTLKPSSPSLASRIGIAKRTTPGTAIRPVPSKRPPKGNVNAEWTHDLHESTIQNQNQNSRTARLNAALSNPAASSNLFNVVSTRKQAPAASAGLSIRGLAGPCAVRAQNFAAGTTAADIESALLPVGGKILGCQIVTQRPMIIAEIIFESREGAETVVQTFDKQMADGKLLHLYIKTGPVNIPATQQTSNNNATNSETQSNNTPTAPRADREREQRNKDDVVESNYGFNDDRMDTDDGYADKERPRDRDRDTRDNRGSGRGGDSYRRSGGGRGLYSDNMIGGNRRGGGDSYRGTGNRYR